MEKTLSIIKPDGVARGLIGEVIKRLESNGLKIIAMKMLQKVFMPCTKKDRFFKV